MRVKGKVAIITGGARGMGESHARLLAAQGAAVGICDIREELGRRVAEEVVAAGGQAQYVGLDVTDEANWADAVQRVEGAFGPVSVLVNNAGIGEVGGGFEREDPAGWDRTVSVNQTGAYLGMRATLPSMRRAGGGSIINVSSVLGFTGDGDAFSYGATKGALRTMSRSAALKLAADGIRVNAVCPGLIRTPMNEIELDAGGYVERTPLGRIGEPVEVSYCVLFLASDESSYVT